MGVSFFAATNQDFSLRNWIRENAVIVNAEKVIPKLRSVFVINSQREFLSSPSILKYIVMPNIIAIPTLLTKAVTKERLSIFCKISNQLSSIV